MYTAYAIITLYEWLSWSYGTQVERDYMNYDYINKEICALSW
jgi:hypothetical protein